MRETEDRLRGLMVHALAGDVAAYHALLEEAAAHLRGFFRRRLPRAPEEVEDLVQETLLAIHNKRHTYDAREPLTPWLYAIARYKLIDSLRRAHSHEAIDASDHDWEASSSLADDEASVVRRDLHKLLDGLPERQRLPIVYVKIEGLSVAEAARRTGMSDSAIKVGVHRGLKALARRIRESP